MVDKVSIVTPVYNRAHLIVNCINSIIDQTYNNWELLIIDDHSSDNIKAVVHKISEGDSRVKYYLNQGKGAPMARNLGLTLARGKYILFLDSDDEVMPEKLEKHLGIFDQNLDLDVTVSQVVRKQFKQTKHISNIEPDTSLITEFITKKIVWKIHAPVWKKEFLNLNHIWFDERLKNSQDYQFYSFCVLNKPRVSYLSEPLSIINDFDNSIDPGKIRGSTDAITLYNHLLSRALVWRYARDKVNVKTKYKLYVYIQRHKISCFKKAFKQNLKSFFELIKLSNKIRIPKID